MMTTFYHGLADVYDRWTANNDYAGWARFTLERLPTEGPARVLDICCGTGRLARLFATHGHDVVGLDGSEAMLAVARAEVPTVRFDRAVLPAATLGEPAAFDVAVCSFDSLNYLAGADELTRAFVRVGETLRPGGLFVFDLNTRHKLEDVFGDSHYGDDLGDFAYVWRNRTDRQARTTEFLISIFVADAEAYRRRTERHVQRWFDHSEVRAAAGAAGFTVEEVVDDYSDKPVSATTQRETWVLRCR
ncbi:class I SAM-dependent methyltransferase [Plantactinospora sp. S1510]|uniref:Class I SAM-dependent methyltransferase n=1 Tax=Plantactinospora alkalitolerans TaxID=2789879 RepID=A0ABS0H172_9ACTN|nr:class I SAM-dependent methyltransferase [Plantactinospora alkalitolerans]MBF9132212.1 class I SAM-dependent methyltransferase [Plantactinospora alkalitolerans]